MIHSKERVDSLDELVGKTVIAFIKVIGTEDMPIVGKLTYQNKYFDRLKGIDLTNHRSLEAPYTQPVILLSDIVTKDPIFISIKKLTSVLEVDADLSCAFCGASANSGYKVSDSHHIICNSCVAKYKARKTPTTKCNRCGEVGFHMDEGVYDLCPDCLGDVFVCEDCNSLRPNIEKLSLFSELLVKNINICNHCVTDSTTFCNSCGTSIFVSPHSPNSFKFLNNERIVCLECVKEYKTCSICGAKHDEVVEVSPTNTVCVSCFASRNSKDIKLGIKAIKEAQSLSMKDSMAVLEACLDKPIRKVEALLRNNTGSTTHFAIKKLIQDLGEQKYPIHLFGVSHFKSEKLKIIMKNDITVSSTLKPAFDKFMIGVSKGKHLPVSILPLFNNIAVFENTKLKGDRLGISFRLRKEKYSELVPFLSAFQSFYTKYRVGSLIDEG